MLAILALVSALQAATPAAGSVPLSLLQWAKEDPLTVTHLLAEAAIPAGVVVREGDYERFTKSQRRWNTDTVNRQSFAREQAAPIAQLVAAFNASHSDYVAEWQAGVFVITPRPAVVTYLDTSRSGQVNGTGLMRTAEKIFAALDSRLDQPGGRAGSRLGVPGVEVDYGDGVAVSLNTDGLTVLQVLNELAKAAPGHPWVVVVTTDAAPRVTQFGFVHERGKMSTLKVSEAR